MDSVQTFQMVDTPPSEERQRFLKEAEQTNVEAGRDPFFEVSIRTRGEVRWILEQHHWSGDVDGYMKARPNLRGADLFGIILRDIILAGADLEGAYCERTDFKGADLRQANLRNTNFVAANLSMATLIEADLTGSNLSLATLENANLAGAKLAGADLNEAHLDHAYLFMAALDGAILNGARLSYANLTRSTLRDARLISASLSNAVLDNSDMTGVRLDRARLDSARLTGANLRGVSALFADLQGVTATETELAGANFTLCDLRGADLRSCRMDASTILDQVRLADKGHSCLLADVRWNGADVTVIDWSVVKSLGDDRRLGDDPALVGSLLKSGTLAKTTKARIAAKMKQQREEALQAAVRANRQVATELGSQGLNEDANRFSYRAHILQRRVLLHQRKYTQYFFSLVLDGLAGYGYVPIRSLIVYLVVIAIYALAYFAQGIYTGHHLEWYAALVVSLTAFHGRGFFPLEFSPADPAAILAASEAVLGLMIEISFIATFTQRFFGK